MLGTAWLLATAPDADVRNGVEAEQFAEEANSQARAEDPNTLDVLAAACAEKGDFAHASEYASRALELANHNNLRALASAIRSRLSMYADQKPFRESPQDIEMQAHARRHRFDSDQVRQ
jgi:hypothetical protein